MELWSIIKANLKSKKGNFISIIILFFVISMALSTIISVSMNSKERVITACKNSNIAEITTFILGNNLTDEMIKKVRESEQVDKFKLKNAVAVSRFEVNGKKLDNFKLLTTYKPSENSYEMYEEDGISLSKDNTTKPKKGEIYLPIALQKLQNCNIGDIAVIDTANGEMQFTISKFFEDPFVGSSMMGVKILLVSDEDFDTIYAQKDENTIISDTIASVYLKDEYKNQQNEAQKEINASAELMDKGFYTFTLQDANRYMTMFVDIINGILWAVAILLYIIVLIVIGHSVSTSIDMDYVTFGILKAEGFTSLQIRVSIMIQYLLSGVVGATAGILASTFIIKYVNAIFIPVTGLCMKTSLRMTQILAIIAGIIAIMALYVIFKTKKVISISPMQAIAHGRGPVHFSGRTDMSVVSGIPLNINGRLILKQVLGDWRKYVTTVVVMALLIAFTMSITSMKQISKADNVYDVFGGYPSEIIVKHNDEGLEMLTSIEKDIQEKTEIINTFSVDLVYLALDNNEILCQILDKSETANDTLKVRVPKYDNEIMVTQITSDAIGKKIGDKVSLSYNNEQYEYIIVGTYQDTSDTGKTITILEDGFKHLNPEFKFLDVEYEIADIKSTASIVSGLKEKYAEAEADKTIEIIDSYKQNKERNTSILAAMDSITAIAYFLAFLFAAIVSFMICQKNFTKEQNDLGVYKSLGFTTGSLRRQFTIKYVLVVAIGGIIGIVMNIMTNDIMLSLLLRNMGITKFITQYTVLLIIGPALFIILCTAVFAWIVSAKIKRVSPKNLINE